MPFEDHIFVSYAHADDPVMIGDEGWIEGLHRVLAMRLKQLRRGSWQIWRDPQLQGNDVFPKVLEERLGRVGVVVAVVSPNYIESEWCQRELEVFLEATGGGQVGSKLRVFKVVKTPVPREDEPEALRSALGYEFYTTDSQSGQIRELALNQLIASPEEMRLYTIKIDDLARNVVDMLPRLEGNGVGSVVAKGCVYLAETIDDLRDERERVRRELEQDGYVVLPDRRMPLVKEKYEEAVRKHLGLCSLSIHMMGDSYGIVPEGAERSTLELQNELAIERAEAGDFDRLIWMPRDLAPPGERQREYIERLKADPRNDETTDLLETTIADFLTVVHQRLEPPKPTRAAAAEDTHKRVYLICGEEDFEDTKELDDLLHDGGFDVSVPAFDGDEEDIQMEHAASLRECDAVLVYYGSEGDTWFRQQLRQIRDAADEGRDKAMIARGVLCAPPDTRAKGRIRERGVVVMNVGGEGITPETLAPFIEALS